jgi:phosphatidylserine/phosphatidylglycerophosphate/cardiolipin synthase-like enzyme
VARKYKLLAFLFFLVAVYGCLIGAALKPPLPSPKQPLIFYSNQSRSDLRLVLKRAFDKAKASILVTMYAVTDEELLTKLSDKAKQGLLVHLWHDPRNPIKTSPPLVATAVKTKGLMHQKICIIDQAIVFLGSANMTTSSLVLHDNLTLGFYHPPLAQFLQHPKGNRFDFTVEGQSAKLMLLPNEEARPALLAEINLAKSSLFVAMFTLTHPELLDAIVTAKERGVHVTIAVDHFAARGASKKAVQFLQAHDIPLLFSQGQQLLHHKWAYIDQKTVILGSTNWTKAAFTKNRDCLLFLYNLKKNQIELFDDLCDTIKLEALCK